MVIIYRVIVDYNLNSQASIYWGSCSIVHVSYIFINLNKNRPFKSIRIIKNNVYR